MDIDLATLPDDVEMLQAMVRSLSADCANLIEAKAEIERLKLIVQTLQRSQFGRRAERLDDDQLQLGFEDLNADIARAEARLPLETPKPSRRASEAERASPAGASAARGPGDRHRASYLSLLRRRAP